MRTGNVLGQSSLLRYLADTLLLCCRGYRRYMGEQSTLKPRSCAKQCKRAMNLPKKLLTGP